MRNKFSHTLLEGNVFLAVFRFAFPFLIANLLQALYGAADLLIVGRFGDSATVSAVATGSPVMQTLTGASVGLITGGTVLIGQYWGAHRRQDLADAVGTLLGVFALISLALTAVMVYWTPAITRLMQAPAEAQAATEQYILLTSCGLVFSMGYNVISGVLRGLGDSLTPLLFVAVACVFNIGGDLLLVGYWHLAAVGAALSTVAAQALSLLLAYFYLRRQGLVLHYRRSRARWRWHTAHHILNLGLPIALQEGLINLSFLVITAILNSLGLTASAAVGVVEKLIIISMLPTTAFASATAIVAAQNQGAGLTRRACGGLLGGIGLSLVLGISCFLWAQTHGAFLTGLFTTDEAVIAAGVSYLHTYSLDCILVCFVFCFNAFFSGCGHALFPLLHSLAATFLLRLPLSYWFSRAGAGSLGLVGWAPPLATTFSLLLCLLFYASGRWRRNPLL